MYNCYIKETGKTITIVICDDSSFVTRQITEYLHAYMQTIPTSLQLYSFSDGHSLISSFQKGNDFDICFLDILMPGFSGMETAREIRHFNTHTRIIFLTFSPEYALESYEVRAYDIFSN
ncbi:MAG: response regulator [Bulleidia sp.]|nr:response regulator [Bulleidia sp.]